MSPSAEILKHYRRPSYLCEARAGLDLFRMLTKLFSTWLLPRRVEKRASVIVVPGFGADDRWTFPLRLFLRILGHRPEGWGLGRNLAGIDIKHHPEDIPARWKVSPPENYRGEGAVAMLCERLRQRVLERQQELGGPVTLVGWSLGGYLAREVARELPQEVEQVITLGAPVVGGPKYTAAADFFRKRGQNLDWVEAEIAKREETPIGQPITAIYSQSDAVVSWPAAIDGFSQRVRHIEVDAAHLSMPFNPTIWNHVIEALESNG